MRRKCQECRLKKCLAVGMRPECVVPETQCAMKRKEKKAQKEKDNKQQAPATLNTIDAYKSEIPELMKCDQPQHAECTVRIYPYLKCYLAGALCSPSRFSDGTLTTSVLRFSIFSVFTAWRDSRCVFHFSATLMHLVLCIRLNFLFPNVCSNSYRRNCWKRIVHETYQH